MRKGTAKDSAERFFAFERAREENRKRIIERTKYLSSKRSYDILCQKLSISMKNLADCLSWAASLTITEDRNWRKSIKCDNVGHEQKDKID